jgi:hypothetical protein
MIEFIFTSKDALTEISLMRAAPFSYKRSSESNSFSVERGIPARKARVASSDFLKATDAGKDARAPFTPCYHSTDRIRRIE